MVATAGQFLNKSGSSWTRREGRGARCVHLRTKMASLSVTDLKGAVRAVGVVKGAGLGSAHFLCVWVSAQKASLTASHLKCTF